MGNHEKNDIYLSEINAEIENRIKEIESADYVFPVRLKKGDWLGFAAIVIICAVTILGLIVFCAQT